MKKLITYLLFFIPFIRPVAQSGDQNQATGTNNYISRDLPQHIFSGKIIDAVSREPLPGASVYIADIKTGAVADAGGKFLFKNISTGHHLVEISHTGYSSVIEHIDIDAELEKVFELHPTIVENRGVVITGVSTATSVRKAPVPVITIKNAELLQSSGTNIIDVLAKEPGVSQLGTGPAISKPIIRGLGGNRVLVINEGVRQEGQQWGDEHGVEIDKLSISKAEILKGPASLMYGSDALAGVVNLITNIPVAEGTIKGNLLTNYQSNNSLWALHANTAGNKNSINWNLYGTLRSAGNYTNRFDGRVLNSAFNEKNAGGYIGINKSWGFSHLILSTFNQQTGLVEGIRDDATGKFLLYPGSALEHIASADELNKRTPLIPRQHISHNKIASDNNFIIGKSRLKLNAGFQKNRRKEFGNPEDKNEKELFFDLSTMTYNVQWVLPEKNEWHITAGANGMYQRNKNRGEETIIPEYLFFDIGGFIYAQRFFDKTTLSGGLRFDNRSVHAAELLEGNILKFAAFDKSFSNISGSIGISYEPADYILFKANVARGFRAPSLAELSSNGAHEGTNRYEYGEENLRSETSLQFDGGIRLDYEHFSVGISAFYNQVNDFIFYKKLASSAGGDSLVHTDGEWLTAFRFDQSNAGLSGLEINFDIHPHPLDWLHFENSLSYVRGKFSNKTDGTDNMPLIPAPRLQSELRADFKKWGKRLRHVYIKMEMDRNFKQDKYFFAFNTETATPAYTLLNAGLGADIVSEKGNTIFSFHFSGMNLTGAAYQSHLSRLKYTDKNMLTGRTGVFNMGRNLSFKLNIPLQFSKMN